ncbi:LysR family transcriptional regulator [Fibrella sp. WM1]|uniref:LysR family transcriptional regulator n=1 Tax=Fibrella musci TaxID=3242485 RepID=UPI003521C6EC
MQSNLEWFRTFKAIYETGTLSAAAKELFISQPGVSLHLNSLEAYTGYKLFDRSARRMLPTEKGKILYNYVVESLKKLEMAEQNFHKRSQADRVTISVGMCFETFQYTLEEHVASLPFNLIIKFGEYHQMVHDLENGLLDIIISPQKGTSKDILYNPFSKERIVLIAGKSTELSSIKEIMQKKNTREIADYLKKQIWYSTAADMEHLKNFWLRNFSEHPDFSPNFIVPNISSIIRCLSNGQGFAIVPDFLCLEAIEQGNVKLVWEGEPVWENILYFGRRKKTMHDNELTLIETIFQNKWTKS